MIRRPPAYDPFARGPLDAHVRTIELIDRERGRTLPVDIWSSADAGPVPLVVYSHSSYGGRRQLAGLLEHLASHGYMAAAPDHVGNLEADIGRAAPGATFEERVEAMIAPRVPDLRFVISELVRRSGRDGLPAVDGDRIAALGWSFGGWAALALPEADDRIAAVVAMVPAGSSNPLPGIIPASLTFEWARTVPTLILAAEQDRFTPVDRVAEVFGRAPEPKRGFVLGGADHDQFADQPTLDLIPREHAHAFRDSLSLAHLDGVLRGNAAARGWLDERAISELIARGVRAQVLEQPADMLRR